MVADRGVLIAVFAGGAVGALARALVADGFPPVPGSWPWATFLVNVAGAFVLGVVVARDRQRLAHSPHGLAHSPHGLARSPHGLAHSSYRRALLGTGFCGAFTTFSAMQIELLWMLDAGEPGLAAGYALASVAAGFGAVRVAGLVVRSRPRVAA